jgi:hypothetical protein
MRAASMCACGVGDPSSPSGDDGLTAPAGAVASGSANVLYLRTWSFDQIRPFRNLERLLPNETRGQVFNGRVLLYFWYENRHFLAGPGFPQG